MSIRLAILVAAAAGGFFLTGSPAPAEAGSRIHLNLYPPFVHVRPRNYPPPGYYYYEEDPYDDYAYDYYGYDEEFEDGPYYDEPPPIKRRLKPRQVYQDPYLDEEPVLKKMKKKKPAQATVAPEKTPNKSTKTAAKPVQKPDKPTQTASKSEALSAPAKSGGKVSCDKARQIVGDYGFSNIESRACAGSIYSFSAQRDGKTFAIKVSSLNGELTEVKRQ
jgi:hypothetical protein